MIEKDPHLYDLLQHSERQNKQVALLGQEVTGCIVRDIPKPPWLHSRGSGCQGCGKDPNWEVLAHSLADCNAPGLDSDGNFFWRGCNQCYSAWDRELKGILYSLRRHLPIACPGCGKPVVSTRDIMLSVRRLPSYG